MPDTRDERTVRFGVRVASEEDLDFTSSRVRAHGWQPAQEERDVDILISFRRGESRIGRRDFHLLYHGTNLLHRSLDAREFEERFETVLVESVESVSNDILCFMGQVVGSPSKPYVYLGQEVLEGVPVLREYGRLTLTTAGELRNLPRGFPAGAAAPTYSSAPLGSALAFAYLRANCFSEWGYAASRLRELSLHLPIVSPDVIRTTFR